MKYTVIHFRNEGLQNCRCLWNEMLGLVSCYTTILCETFWIFRTAKSHIVKAHLILGQLCINDPRALHYNVWIFLLNTRVSSS